MIKRIAKTFAITFLALTMIFSFPLIILPFLAWMIGRFLDGLQFLIINRFGEKASYVFDIGIALICGSLIYAIMRELYIKYVLENEAIPPIEQKEGSND